MPLRLCWCQAILINEEYRFTGVCIKKAHSEICIKSKKKEENIIVAYMLQFGCILSETSIWVCYPNKKLNFVMLLNKAGDKPSPETTLTRCDRHLCASTGLEGSIPYYKIPFQLHPIKLFVFDVKGFLHKDPIKLCH